MQQEPDRLQGRHGEVGVGGLLNCPNAPAGSSCLLLRSDPTGGPFKNTSEQAAPEPVSFLCKVGYATAQEETCMQLEDVVYEKNEGIATITI